MHWDAKKRKAQTNARRSASGRSSNEGHHAGALPQDAAAMANTDSGTPIAHSDCGHQELAPKAGEARAGVSPARFQPVQEFFRGLFNSLMPNRPGFLCVLVDCSCKQ